MAQIKPSSIIKHLLFEELDEDNIRDLKSINHIVLGMTYPKKFYKNILQNGFGHLVINNKTEKVMAGYSCIHEKKNKIAYIATFGVYAAERRKGIGSILINEIAQKYCIENGINAIKLHCKYNNVNVIKFYQSNGFVIERKINNYYTDCSDDSSIAIQMKKTIK